MKFWSHFSNWLVNWKCWTSDMQKNENTNEVQVSYMMFWALVTVVTVFLWHQSFVTSKLLMCHNQISLTTQIPWSFPDIVPFPWPVQNSLTFPGFQKFQTSSNPEQLVTWKKTVLASWYKQHWLKMIHNNFHVETRQKNCDAVTRLIHLQKGVIPKNTAYRNWEGTKFPHEAISGTKLRQTIAWYFQ